MGNIIIENIGDSYYMFPWVFGACDGSWAGPLRCYEDANYGNYNFNTAPSCDYTIVGINEKELRNKINIRVYPSPASNQICIETDFDLNKRFYYNIYNIFGQLIKKNALYSNHSTITTLDINNGVYNIVISADGRVAKKCFIIEK